MLEIEDEAILTRFLFASDRSFEVLEHACRRRNDANLISWGLRSLVQHLPAFTVDAFCAAPRKLARAARILGGVQPPVRAAILRTCGGHPLFQLEPLTAPILEACTKILASCGQKYVNPMPARLKLWCKGEIA